MRIKIFLLTLVVALSSCELPTELSGLYSNEQFGLSFSYDSSLFDHFEEVSFDGGTQVTFYGDGFRFIALARDHLPMIDVPKEGYLKLVPDELYGVEKGQLVDLPVPFYDDMDASYDLVVEGLTVGALENYQTNPGKYYSFALSFDSFQEAKAFDDSGYELFSQVLSSLEFTWEGTLTEEIQPLSYCGVWAVTAVPLFEVYGESIRVPILCPKEMGEDFFQKGKTYQLTLSPFSQFTINEEESANSGDPFYSVEQVYWLKSISALTL